MTDIDLDSVGEQPLLGSDIGPLEGLESNSSGGDGEGGSQAPYLATHLFNPISFARALRPLASFTLFMIYARILVSILIFLYGSFMANVEEEEAEIIANVAIVLYSAFVYVFNSPMFYLTTAIGTSNEQLAKLDGDSPDREQYLNAVGRDFQVGLAAALVYSVAPFLLLSYSESVVTAITGNAAWGTQAEPFFRWVRWSVPFTALQFTFSQFSNGLKKVALPLTVSTLVCAPTALLAYGLTLGKFGLPKYGYAGTGIAIFLDAFSSFILTHGYLLFSQYRGKGAYVDYRLYQRHTGQLERLAYFFKKSLPIAVDTALELGTYVYAFGLASRLGAVAETAQLVPNQYQELLIAPVVGAAIAASVVASNNISNAISVRNIGRASLFVGLVIPAVFLATSQFLVGPYSKPFLNSEHESYAGAMNILDDQHAFLFFSINLFLDTVRNILTSLLRGVNMTARPVIPNVVGLWSGAGFATLLATTAGMGLAGIYLGFIIGEILAICGQLYLWSTGTREIAHKQQKQMRVFREGNQSSLFQGGAANVQLEDAEGPIRVVGCGI